MTKLQESQQSGQVQTAKAKPTSLVQFFRESPLVRVDLDLDRGRDPVRDVEL